MSQRKVITRTKLFESNVKILFVIWTEFKITIATRIEINWDIKILGNDDKFHS